MALLAVMLAMADSVTPERALSMAQAFMSGGKATFCASEDVSLKLAYQAHSLEGKPDYYVFNRGNGGGYIVVTGDDRTLPVWGYSTNGSFDYESMPDNAKWWFSEYQRQLQYLRDHPEAKPRQPITLSRSVDALIKTKWDQYQPYNAMCPVAPDSLGVGLDYYATIDGDEIPIYYFHKACTGCVATALAQIMNYYKWPQVGTGNKSYESTVESFTSIGSNEEQERTVRLSADFSKSSYQWSKMKNLYRSTMEGGNIFFWYLDNNGQWIKDSESGWAVSKLMSDVGIAVEMDYGAPGRGGSYSHIGYAKAAMENYFQYSAELKWRDDEESTYVVDGSWDQRLREEIDDGKPIYYRGTDDAAGGHAFVLDGYDNEGRFHVNWGWSGKHNDVYYYSYLLNPDSYNFKTNQAALFLTPLNGSYSDEPVKTLSVAMPKGNAGKVLKGGVKANLPFTVYGNNLDQEVTFTLSGSDADQFFLARSSVSAAEANSGVNCLLSYIPTRAGAHTAQLIVSAGSDVDPVILDLKGHAVLYYDADGDATVNVHDLTAIIDALLTDGSVAYTDQSISIGEVTGLIDYMLTGNHEMDVEDGLVAYYPFDGDAHDASGHGNDGVLYNVTPTTGTYGEANGAYQFGGYYNKGYICIPNSESLQFTDGFSFACFVKPTDWRGMDSWADYVSKGNHTIFAKSIDRNGPHMSFSGSNEDFVLGVGSFVDKWSELNSGSINGNYLNDWVHVAVTYNKTTASMYVNGRLVDRRSITPDFSSMNNNDFYFGSFPYNVWTDYWYPLNGVLDEVRIYNRALTDIEVLALAEGSEQAYAETHPFKLSQRAVNLSIGEHVTIEILNGNGSYSIGGNTGIVDFTLNQENESITLTGIAEGTTTITVIDVATQTTILLPVTVIQPDNKKLLLSEEVNGVRYRLFKEVLDQNDTHVNADGWTFFRSRLSLDVIRNNVARTYVLDENLYLDSADNDAQTATMLFDLRTSEMKVFINSKTSGSNYSMDGFCYTSSMNSIAYSKETVFSSKNWGWWPFWVYSNGSISLSHFSYGGYYYMTSSRNESGTWSNTTGRKIYPNDFRSIWEQTDLTLVIQ